MRAFVLAAALVVAVSAGPVENNYLDLPRLDNFAERGECHPGQTFYDVCNVCYCSPDGKSAACTLKACLPVEKLRIDGYAHGMKCPAGKTFYDDCNACKCGNNGLSASCTLMACPPRHPQLALRSAVSDLPHIDNFSEIGQCTPGKTFKDNCNTCRCDADGASAFCTLMACPEYEFE